MADASVPIIVLLGADRITPSGHVVNKTGSNVLANFASSFLKSEMRNVVVLGETDKISVPPRDTIQSYSELVENDVSLARDTSSSTESKVALAHRLSKAELQSQPYEQHGAKEVYSAWDEKTQKVLVPYIEHQNTSAVQVEIQNNYFEFVKAELIDHYISENGEMTVAQITTHSVESFKLEETIFANLYD